MMEARGESCRVHLAGYFLRRTIAELFAEQSLIYRRHCCSGTRLQQSAVLEHLRPSCKKIVRLPRLNVSLSSALLSSTCNETQKPPSWISDSADIFRRMTAKTKP